MQSAANIISSVKAQLHDCRHGCPGPVRLRLRRTDRLAGTRLPRRQDVQLKFKNNKGTEIIRSPFHVPGLLCPSV